MLHCQLLESLPVDSLKMNLLFVADDVNKLNEYKDSTIYLIQQAWHLNLNTWLTTFQDLSLNKSKNLINCIALAKLIKHGKSQSWFDREESKTLQVTSFDYIFIRTDPPINYEYLASSYVLDFAEEIGIPVVNSPKVLRNFNEKLLALKFPNHTPDTIVTCDKEVILNFLGRFERVVLKPLNLMGGKDIFTVSNSDPNTANIVANLTKDGRQKIIVQEFLPEIKKGDKRIILINGTVIEYCLNRVPAKNSFLGNLASGGKGNIKKLTAEEKLIAQEIAIKLKNYGIFLAGIDMIGKFLTEINITSPTGFKEISSFENVGEVFFNELFKCYKK